MSTIAFYKATVTSSPTVIFETEQSGVSVTITIPAYVVDNGQNAPAELMLLSENGSVYLDLAAWKGGSLSFDHDYTFFLTPGQLIAMRSESNTEITIKIDA